jgi:hypothetical protein
MVEEMSLKEYCDLSPISRLQALATLVDDCLQTKTLRFPHSASFSVSFQDATIGALNCTPELKFGVFAGTIWIKASKWWTS